MILSRREDLVVQRMDSVGEVDEVAATGRFGALPCRSERDHAFLHGQGDAWSSEGVRIRYLLTPEDIPRFAISVPKSCGNAVVRNRIRRVWREAISQIAPILPAGDYHVMIRNPVLAGSYATAHEILTSFQATVVI